VNGLEHLHHGPDLIGGETLQSFNIYFADDAPDQPKNGFRIFRERKRPNSAIAWQRAPLRPSIGFHPVHDAHQTRRIDLADLRKALLADTLVFREHD